MKFEIEHSDKNNYTVRSGDRYQDGLCWDEMLGLVARLTMNGDRIERCLKTKEEHAKSPYSTEGTERRREDSYTALCGISDRSIRSANGLFASNVESRLIYLLGVVQAENDQPLFADDAPPAGEVAQAIALALPAVMEARPKPEPIPNT